MKLVRISCVVFSFMAVPAHAAYVMTVLQSNGNVVVSGSGTLNLTGLTVVTTGLCGGGHMGPSNGQLEVGQLTDDTPCTEYGISGPASFGSGGYSIPNSGTGQMAGVFESELVTNSNYVSGTQTSGTATWNSATFASLGLTPGTYVYTWGSGANADSLTVEIGPAVISQVLNATQEAAAISQNTWIEIKGTNLAQTQRIWQASDFDPKTGLMPVQLDGVSVTVNGKPAYVYYLSPTQVNVLTPIDAALGSVAVQVTTSASTSNVFMVTMLGNSLGFFAFNSGKYAAAEHANGSYIGPTTLYPGLSTPAQPGETIVLYANGFGETNPPISPGAAVQQGQLPNKPAITLGGLPVSVINAAVVTPGLYQFNVVVPANAPNGDLALQASYNGFSTQSGVLLTVSNGAVP